MDLYTDRLVLRLWSSDEIATVVHGRRMGHWATDFPAEGDRVIAGVIDEQPEGPGAFGHRLVLERESGLAVGSISLFWPPKDGAIEVGYGIAASRQGRGYATEATRALVEFALNLPDVRTVYADIELSNPASARVVEKAGLRLWHDGAETARFVVGAAPSE